MTSASSARGSLSPSPSSQAASGPRFEVDATSGDDHSNKPPLYYELETYLRYDSDKPPSLYYELDQYLRGDDEYLDCLTEEDYCNIAKLASAPKGR